MGVSCLVGGEVKPFVNMDTLGGSELAHSLENCMIWALKLGRVTGQTLWLLLEVSVCLRPSRLGLGPELLQVPLPACPLPAQTKPAIFGAGLKAEASFLEVLALGRREG